MTIDSGSKKIEFHSHLALGDTIMVTCAIRDLKKAFGEKYLIGVDTTAMHVWDYNPHLTVFDDPDHIVKIGPRKAVQASQHSDLHYANGFRKSIEENLNIIIPQGPIKPDLHLSDEEKKDRWIDGRYWIVVAGGKPDFGTKIWPPEYWQEVISRLPHITFVQLGAGKHHHPEMKGHNVINLLGQTEDEDNGIRDLFKLFYHCDGSLGLVSMQMHLAAAFNKACVTVAGAREPDSFEQYNHHRYLSNMGALRCKNDCNQCFNIGKNKEGKTICNHFNGPIPEDYIKSREFCIHVKPKPPHTVPTRACWKSKLEYCSNLIDLFGKKYPRCISMITPDDVIRGVQDYYKGGALHPLDLKKKVSVVPRQPSEPFIVPHGKPVFKMVCNAHAYIGGERSTAWIMAEMIKTGYHVQLVPTKHVCTEFLKNIPGVEITNDITAPCDIIMIYANDMIWEFEKEHYKIMEDVQAKKKIMMLNFKLGGAGKAEWTKKWDLYGFLCSQMRDEFLKRVPGAECFILPPAVNLGPFLSQSVRYNKTLHLVRHSSQGDSKHPKDTLDLIAQIREVSPNCEFSFMPPPSFLDEFHNKKVHKFSVNQLPVPEFLARGSCFWYRLPDNYSDQGPRTIVEAMAVGLPCIADNRWGAKDRITEETGWLCDTKDDYIEVIKSLNHKVLQEKGLAAKERARTLFDPHNWIKVITA